MSEVKEFQEWYETTYLFSLNPTSTILNSDNKTIKAKFLRICQVCKLILDNPNKTNQELREEIAIDMFVSLRCALDYLVYAKLVLKKWEKFKQTLK